MVITASLLATKLLAEIAIYITKGVEEVGKRSCGDVYDKIKLLLKGKGEGKAVEDFEAEPKASESVLKQQISALMEADMSLRTEVEQALRDAGVDFSGSMSVGSINQGDNGKVAVIGTATTVNM